MQVPQTQHKHVRAAGFGDSWVFSAQQAVNLNLKIPGDRSISAAVMKLRRAYFPLNTREASHKRHQHAGDSFRRDCD